MKKRISIVALILILSLTLLCLIGCGSKGSNSELRGDGSSNKPGYDYSQGVGDGKEDNGIGSLPSGGVDNPNAKIIKTANANISTKSFDGFIEKLYKKITEYSGYTDGETLGNSYSGGRYANITVRIPADKLDAFKDELSGLGTLTYYSAEKQDVTLTYSTLKAELDTLTSEVVIIEELFTVAKASGDLTKIAEIEKRLTEVRLRIAKIDAEIKVYDNQIAYSTIHLNVTEVEEEIVEEEEEKGAFARIGENLKRGFINVWGFIVELFIFLLSALPYILLISVFASVALFIVFFSIKRKRERREKSEEKSEEENKNE